MSEGSPTRRRFNRLDVVIDLAILTSAVILYFVIAALPGKPSASEAEKVLFVTRARSLLVIVFCFELLNLILDGWFARARSRTASAYTALGALLASRTFTKQATTAIAAVAERKRRVHRAASAILGAAILIQPLTALALRQPMNFSLFIVLAAAIAVVNLGTSATSFRIARGLYGTNAYEAREIIRFVLDNADTTDFSGGIGAAEFDISAETEHAAEDIWAGAPA